MLRLVNFDRVMTPKSTEMFIMAMTSKTGRSVAHNNTEYFYLDV